MKKLLASIVLALMVIALPVGLVGCKNKSGSNDPIVGNYKFAYAYTSDGSDVSTYLDSKGISELYHEGWNFYANKTARDTWNGEEGDVYNWKNNGNGKYTISYEEKGRTYDGYRTFFIKDKLKIAMVYPEKKEGWPVIYIVYERK